MYGAQVFHPVSKRSRLIVMKGAVPVMAQMTLWGHHHLDAHQVLYAVFSARLISGLALGSL
eukprot:4722023-Karenia_brevis.AAC.1